MKIKIFIYFVLFFLSLEMSYSQVQPEWVRDVHPGCAGGFIVYDTAGFIVISGSAQSMDSPPGTEVIRYTSSGDQMWDKTCYGWNCGLSVDNSHCTYIASYTYFSWGAPKQMNLIKYNAAGVETWRVNDTLFWEPDRLISMKGDYWGNSFMLMYRDSLIEISKYNSSGTREWVRNFSAPGSINNIPAALNIDKWGNAIIAGRSYSSNNSGFHLVKYNSLGEQLWTTQFIPQTYFDFYTMDITSDTAGNIFAAYVLRDTNAVSHLLISKYSPAGAEQWTRTYGQPVSADQVRIITDNSGSVISSIYYTGIIKYNGSGVFQWNLNTNVSAAAVDKNLDIYFTKSTAYNSYSFYKYNNAGVYKWETAFSPGTNCNYLGMSGIVLDTSFNIYINGGYSYLSYPYFWNPATLTVKYNQLVGISNVGSQLPVEFRLFQNYPNPFNPSTKIRFELPESGDVKLIVYDIQGREIQVLINNEMKTGSYEIQWSPGNLASGIYFYSLITKSINLTKKLILLK